MNASALECLQIILCYLWLGSVKNGIMNFSFTNTKMPSCLYVATHLTMTTNVIYQTELLSDVRERERERDF